jgi:hypothetical protein
MKIQNLFIFLIICGLVLPIFALSQGEMPQAPETVEEASGLGLKILGGLPDAIKKVWVEQALPIWQGMWNWVKPYLEPWWQKFLSFWSKKKPELKGEFQKEKQEMKEDLPNVPGQTKSMWERFKNFWR